jgi:hypothetical protein
VAVLCEWHGIVCGGLSDSAGRVRSKAVRVGHVTFRPARHVPRDLRKVCDAIGGLERRLRSSSSSPLTTHATAAGTGDATRHPPESPLPVGLQAALFAAAVYFAVVDTHAFSDGNGRLARIAGNYALRRFGFPVPIHLFATPAQRKECVRATMLTRRNLTLLSRGEVDRDVLIEAYRAAGAFTPLLRLFVDRMDRAVAELTRLVHDKQRVSHEEAQIQAANLFRQGAAASTCLICFDDAPNVATLCCGKAVHFNCLAEWLLAKSSCPNCRGDLPALPQRILRSSTDEDDNDDDDEDDDTTSTIDSTTSSVVYDSSTTSGSSGVEAAAGATAANPGSQPPPDDDDSETFDDDTTSVAEEDAAAPAAAAPGPSSHRPDAMSVDDTTDDDATTEVCEPEPGDGCRTCNNRAARDCQNGLCGQCCFVVGQFQCVRHKNYG